MTSQPQNAPRSPASPGRVNRGRVTPMASVALITGAALVGVGVLAVQANGSGPKTTANAPVTAASTAPTTNASGQPAQAAPNPTALPDNSGSGKRIVYSPSRALLWLVGADNKPILTAQTVPGTVTPPPNTYTVSKMRNTSIGGDGTAVQYLVLFGDGFGFDAVAGLPPTEMPPKPGSGAAVRITQASAFAVWQFAAADQHNTKVVVVP